MVNSRIVFNTLNAEKQLTAKEYQLKIAQGIVGGFSSRTRSISTVPTKTKSCSIRTVVTDHLPIVGDRDRCKYCQESGKDLKSYVYCTTCKVVLCLNKDRNCFMLYHQDG